MKASVTHILSAWTRGATHTRRIEIEVGTRLKFLTFGATT